MAPRKRKLMIGDKPSERFGFGRGSAKDLNGEHMPFSTYVDRNTIITNNGELMQTIMIGCESHGANFDGAMRSAVQRAVSAADPNDPADRYAFWLHTIRDEVSNKAAIIEEGELAFGHIVKHNWQKVLKLFGNFNTITYITVVKAGKDLSLRPSNITRHLNKHILYRWHDSHVRQGIASLNKFTDSIIAQLSSWKVRKLGMVLRDDVYYSEHLEFWNNFTNFCTEQYRVPIANLSKVLNISAYNFYFDFGVARNTMSEEKRYFAIFSVKDCHALHRDVFAQLVNGMGSVKFCEIMHFDQRREVEDAYKQQYDCLQISEDKDLTAALDLDKFFNDSKSMPTYRRVVMIMLDAAEKKSLDIKTAALFDKMSQVGLVIATEDIGLARSFYAFMPGNFNYIKHSDFVGIEDVGIFIYSHIFGHDDVTRFLDNKPLCVLPTVRQNPYFLGILKAKPDILVVDESSYFQVRTTWVNFLLSLLPSSTDITIIESSSFSRNFVDLNGGKSHLLSLQKKYNTCHINPMAGIGTWPEYSTFLFDMLILFAELGHVTLGDDGNAFVSQVVAHALDRRDAYGHFSDFTREFEGTPLEDILIHWYGNGTRAHILDSIEEDIFIHRGKGPVCVTLHHDVIGNRPLTAALVYMLLYNIICTASKERDHVIVLHDIFLLFSGKYCTFLAFLMRISRHYNATFIITTSAHDAVINWPSTPPDITVGFDTKCHISSFSVTDQYCETFGLTAGERYALERLPKSSIMQPAMLLKQGSAAVAVQPDFSSFAGDVIGTLCNSDLANKNIQKMMEHGGDQWLQKALIMLRNQKQ